MKRNYIPAALIALGVILWLLSGWLGKKDGDTPPAPSLVELDRERAAQQEDQRTAVRGRIVQATEQTALLSIRGRTEVNRAVDVRAEISGRVVALERDRGDPVQTGDLICRLHEEDRRLLVKKAEDEVRRAQIEYSGALQLQQQNLLADSAVANALATLTAAEADLRRRQIDLENTHIRAPFAGMIETRPVEIGAFMQPGQICARLIDLDPLLLIGQIAERDVHKLQLGQTAEARLLTGEIIAGTVAFLGRDADDNTRTYDLEINVPNPTAALRSGTTADVLLPIGVHQAHLVSASLLTLDDTGILGVRTLDADNRVVFNPVAVIKEDERGIWITGLPQIVTIITVGQELVVPGEIVDLSYEDDLRREAGTGPSTDPSTDAKGGIPAVEASREAL